VLHWVWDSQALPAAVDILRLSVPEPACFFPGPATVSSQRANPAHGDTAAVCTGQFSLRGFRDYSKSLVSGAGS